MFIKQISKSYETFVGIAISIIAFIVYVITLSPTLNFIDSGELATVACTLGIAHPTGYPLFSIVGWLFSHIPLGFRPIYQLNLMAAVFCSIGLYFFYRFLLFALKQFNSDFSKRRNETTDKSSSRYFIMNVVPSIFGTMVLAFSETYWSQALSIEVYSLHVLLISIILLLFTKAAIIEKSSPQKNSTSSKYWISFALILGLSLTNHMTTILLAPAFIYLFFNVNGYGQRAWKRILFLGVPFLIGFSVQLYLPLRSSENPIMNWGNPIDFEKWFWHFSGKVYRVWIFSSTESAAKQFNYFINSLSSEFAYFPLLFAVLGLWNLFKRWIVLFTFTILLFLSCLLYSINYDIHDIDSYFLLAYITITIWIAFGSHYIISLIKNRKYANVFCGILLLSVIGVIANNYSSVDQSDNYMVEDYTKDIFKYIEKDGIVISYQWDYFVSAAYYLQIVEKYRPDIVVIDKELLRRSWYYNQLNNRYPWLIDQSKKELDGFLNELNKFEHNRPYNPEYIEYQYSKLIKSFIEKNYFKRPIYITPEIEAQYTSGYNRVPSGLVFRLYADTIKQQAPPITFQFRIPKHTNLYSEAIISLYAQSYLNNAIYSNILGDKREAITYLNRAMDLRPNMKEAIYMREKLMR